MTDTIYKEEALKLAQALDDLIESIEPRIDNTAPIDGDVYHRAYEVLINSLAFKKNRQDLQKTRMKKYKVVVRTSGWEEYQVSARNEEEAEARFHDTVYTMKPSYCENTDLDIDSIEEILPCGHAACEIEEA